MLAVAMRSGPPDCRARTLFLTSIVYLPILFAMMVFSGRA